MTASVPLYRGNDFYVPAFRVAIGGQQAALAQDLISLTFHDSLEAFDSVDLELNNWNDGAQGATNFIYAVDAAAPQAGLFSFRTSTPIDVSIGYQPANIVRVFSGSVVSIEPHYPAGSAPTLTVRLVDRLSRLADATHTKTWTDKSVADIARAIARTHEVEIEIVQREDDQPQPYFFQQNQLDMVFLMQLSRRLGYDLSMDPAGKLHLGPASKGATATYKLGFRSSIIDFAPRFTMNEQFGKVVVLARDQGQRATFRGEATRSEAGINADLESFVSEAVQKKVKTVTNQPLHVNGQAKQLARELMRNIMQQMLTATITCPGLPEIRAGRMIEITDVGSRFSGPYLVTSSTHTIDDSGYKTSFTARREKRS